VLARALLAGAPVLVLEEPTAHLDPSMADEVVHDVLTAAEDRVLLITHRPEGSSWSTAWSACDHRGYLERGTQ